jgi:hypothetical protein
MDKFELLCTEKVFNGLENCGPVCRRLYYTMLNNMEELGRVTMSRADLASISNAPMSVLTNCLVRMRKHGLITKEKGIIHVVF